MSWPGADVFLADASNFATRLQSLGYKVLDNLRLALRPLRRLYGHAPARDFGPVGLRTVREAMVRDGLGRTTINARVNRIRRVFKWAASIPTSSLLLRSDR